MWIFGYGSLIWKPNFPVETSLTGHVKGFIRRFYQRSPDHRGTEEYPGRTVTLIPDEQGRTYGIAYKVPSEQVTEVRAYLDHREKAGYQFSQVAFVPDDTSLPEFEVNVYISPQECNEYYTGGETVEQIADVVVKAHGPSGSNIEYVLKLANSLRQMGTLDHDEHISQLEAAILSKCHSMNITDPCIKELGLKQG